MEKRIVYILTLVYTPLCFSGMAKAQGCVRDSMGCCKKNELSLGGYGEAVISRIFYSNNINRYSKAERYKDAKSRGQAGLPHVVMMLGYDFGKGWTMNLEIELEHGGTESAMEMEDKEFSEREGEIERGGEVVLERFWIQRSFCPELNICASHDVVPTGYIDVRHSPTEFFTVCRSERGNQILPCTWHQAGVPVWGRWKFLRCQAMFLPGFNSFLFSKDQQIKNGSASALESVPADKYATAIRLDFYPLKKLRIGLSGYYGGLFNNTLQSDERGKYRDVKGTATIGTIDMNYASHGWHIPGGFDYGHLGDVDIILACNHSQSSTSPYERTLVGNRAHVVSVQAGYNVMRFFPCMRSGKQQLSVLGAYENYNAYHPVVGNSNYEWTDRNRITSGFNYHPTKQAIMKGEYSNRFLRSKFNNEPSVSLDMAYTGSFLQSLQYDSNNKGQKE